MPRIVLVDTFKDEAEEALRVAHALGDRLYGIRLDTPSERGRVTADLVHEVRARLDQAGFDHVKIVVSGGLNPERIRYFKEAGAPVDSYAVGSYISGATPIDFTGDIKEIDGRPIAKRGRIPGLTESPRLKPVDLAAVPRGDRPTRPDGTARALRATIRAWSPGGLTRPTTTRSARAPTSCSSAARRCSSAATTRRPRSSSSAPIASSRGRARSSRRSGGRTSTPARPSAHAAPSRRCSTSIRRRRTRTTPSVRASSGSAGAQEAGTHLRLAVALSPETTLYREALDRLGEVR